jgi:minor extracellular protease Epr
MNKKNAKNASISLEKTPVSRLVTIPTPISYSPSKMNINIDPRWTGKDVRIAILDTGLPVHQDLTFTEKAVSFCDSNKNTEDKVGHATILSGIIISNQDRLIRGVAPKAKLLHGKVMSDDQKCSFNSLIAGVLWSIVKEVDIIVIALGSQYDYKILHDALIKARNQGICIFAAAGSNIDSIDYPANYKEVFSCGFLTRYKNQNDIIKSKVDFYISNTPLYSTFLNNQYIQIGGSSISTAFFAGVGALLIEYYKSIGLHDNIPKLVYNDLLKMLR